MMSSTASQPARPRAAVSSEQETPPIDLVHLSRQTLGDRQLEIELLSLFANQARTIAARLAASRASAAAAAGAGDLLQTLSGSARTVGSWAVAAEAQALELDLRRNDAGLLLDSDKLIRLERSVDRACAVVDDLIMDAA